MSVDESVLRAWSLFVDAYAALFGRLEPEMKQEVGISFSWFDVLATLVTTPDHHLRMGDLVDRVLISFSRVSRVVGELESHGLVERSTDPDDRRGVIVKLTDSGQALHGRAAKMHIRGVEEHFGAHTSSDERIVLVNVFERILSELGREPSPLRPAR